MNMVLLIVEDKPDSVKGIVDYYKDKCWNVIVKEFKEALECIEKESPDIIILDWMDDVGDDKGAGKLIFDKAQNKPIIVFSALAGALSLDDVTDNPFIDKIPKGDESVVIKRIDEWERYLKLVNEVKNQINEATSFMMASLRPAVKLNSGYPGDAVVKFMLNKQASEFFNSRLDEYDRNPTWTQYLYPPLSSKLLVADVLKSVAEEKYFVLLTPSCDMARAGEDKEVLIASCVDCHKFHDYGQIDNFGKKDISKVKTVSKLLSYGYNTFRVPLPELPNVFPFLTVNLKDLQFVELSKIAVNLNEVNSSIHSFVRLASVNSPYREQIVWAHMVNSCRPGVPDRDYELWAENILK